MRQLLVVVACAALAAPAAAQGQGGPSATSKGRTVYVRYCVSCHGPAGEGDGPLAHDLKVGVPDLTTLASRNGGTFPSDRVRRVIDLGEPLRGHGTPDMPAWGDAFKKTQGIEAAQPREAIRNLTAYLASLQRKKAP
jgi:mono/diheme cytochrome c family protein